MIDEKAIGEKTMTQLDTEDNVMSLSRHCHCCKTWMIVDEFPMGLGVGLHS
jgi:hypothetical protein